MAVNLSFLKRLIKEDFDKKDQDLVGKIAYILNPAVQQIANILSHGLNVSDLNAQVKDLEVVVDSTGAPTNDASFQSSLNGRCNMLVVGRAQSLLSPPIYPTGGHSVSFTENNGLITITNITGLPANSRFSLRIIAYV